MDLDGWLNWLEGGILLVLFVVFVVKVFVVFLKLVMVVFEWLFFVYGDFGSLLVSGDECIVYNVVFDVFKVGKYDDFV